MSNQRQKFQVQGSLLKIATQWFQEEYRPYLDKLKTVQLDICKDPDFGFYIQYDLWKSERFISGVSDIGVKIPGLKKSPNHEGMLVADRRTKKGKNFDELFKSLVSPEIIGPLRIAIGHDKFYFDGSDVLGASYSIRNEGTKCMLSIPIEGVSKEMKENPDLIAMAPIDVSEWWEEDCKE